MTLGLIFSLHWKIEQKKKQIHFKKKVRIWTVKCHYIGKAMEKTAFVCKSYYSASNFHYFSYYFSIYSLEFRWEKLAFLFFYTFLKNQT